MFPFHVDRIRRIQGRQRTWARPAIAGTAPRTTRLDAQAARIAGVSDTQSVGSKPSWLFKRGQIRGVAFVKNDETYALSG